MASTILYIRLELVLLCYVTYLVSFFKDSNRNLDRKYVGKKIQDQFSHFLPLEKLAQIFAKKSCRITNGVIRHGTMKNDDESEDAPCGNCLFTVCNVNQNCLIIYLSNLPS